MIRMIEEAIKIHDKFQFEIKLGYLMQADKKETVYDVDTYIFVPDSLGINDATYSKNDFYNENQAYIRLKTPEIRLSSINDGEDSPLGKIGKAARRLLSGDPAAALEYEDQVKLFCSILKTSLRSHVQWISKLPGEDAMGRGVREHITLVTEIAAGYRKLADALIGADLKFIRIFELGDESVSLLIGNSASELLEEVLPPGAAKRFREPLLSLMREEIDYRRAKKYPIIPNDEGDNEAFLYRKSILKKYMATVLYLNKDTRAEGRIAEQVSSGVAAGIAMVFATAASFYAQYRYGQTTFPFFVALVVSYMFKDRIKELIKIQFAKSIGTIFFDHKTSIYSGSRNRLGICREAFSFMPGASVPESILRIRNKSHYTEIESGWLEEKIMLYRKRIIINTSNFDREYHIMSIRGIDDILKFNIMRFVHRMHNPKEDLYVLDQKGLRKVYGDRVYHLNMIIKYSMEDSDTYKRFRIILNREGIKRIEEVSADQEAHHFKKINSWTAPLNSGIMRSVGSIMKEGPSPQT